MSKKEKKAKGTALQEDIKLDIPEDEIWTYQIPGLAAPHINKPYKHYGLKKIIFAIVIIIAVSLSMYFSVRTVYNETFEYTELESGYQFDKFSNSGYITELDIDYVSTIEYDDDNKDPMTNFTIVKDEAKKVTEIREYALNCDGTVKVVNIGADVEKIDGKSFYSCWALQRIEVDENNPYYCDVDGVLYNKDKTEIICVPCDRDQYLRDKYGYAEEVAVEDAKYAQYEKDVLTYVIPSTVEKVGKLCFNYANLTTVYIPEGVKTIETLGFYEIPMLKNVYSYVAENEITDTRYTSNEALGKVYRSLPEGLEYIGSDAFTECRALSYVYIPSSVNYIGHHAFWDTVSKDGDTFNGVSAINVAMDEESFKDVHTGDEWSPRYLVLIFTKSVDINYSAEREPMEIVEPDQKLTISE